MAKWLRRPKLLAVGHGGAWMLNFSCPRCRQKYHADETHVGKSIRCTECGDIVTVAGQDISYSSSASPIQTVEGKSAIPDRSGAAADVHTRVQSIFGRRAFLFASATFLCLLLGYVCFQIGKAHRESASDGFVPDKAQTAAQVTASNLPPLQADARKEPAPVNLNSSDVDTTSGLVAKQARASPKMSPQTGKQQAPEYSDAGTVPGPQHQARSLPNGTRIIPDLATSGHGELEAVNGTSYDAYVLVVDTRRNLQVRWVFIHRGQSFTLDHIDPGDYRVVFATGLDWDGSIRRFNHHAEYFAVGKNLSFEESQDTQKIGYYHHSITLNAVPNGNVGLVHLTEAQFLNLSGN